MTYPSTELVLNQEGKVYHLGLARENVSETILLVGDQGRVDLVASFFDSIEHESQHREFFCKTGTFNGKRITVLSTGIGTDNIDITINELDALFNINLKTRENLSETTSLRLIRIGTCGILHPEIPVHSYILSSHAYGLDNVAHFYQIPFNADEISLNQTITDHLQLPEGIHTYLTEASEELLNLLKSERTHIGVTVTSSGFYGPQGRQLRLATKTGHINDRLSSFNDGKHKITNFEMESSALFSLGKALGHECVTICLGIANRPKKEFSSGYNEAMLELIEYVLDRV